MLREFSELSVLCLPLAVRVLVWAGDRAPIVSHRQASVEPHLERRCFGMKNIGNPDQLSQVRLPLTITAAERPFDIETDYRHPFVPKGPCHCAQALLDQTW